MFTIPLDQDEQEESASLLTEYGRLSKEQVDDEIRTYIEDESRARQDDNQIYVCLMTLTKEAKDKMLLLKSAYSFDGNPSGIAFLKAIISESHVDTNATKRLLRAKLSALDAYMVTVESDITKFN